MEEQFNVSPEVVEPEIVTEEVVTPQETEAVETEQEAGTPDKIEQTPEENSKFKELRLKHEKELSDAQARFYAQQAELQKKLDALNPIKEKYEQDQYEQRLESIATQFGISKEEAREAIEEEQEKESLRQQLAEEKEQREKERMEKEEIKKELDFQKMFSSDKEVLRSIDPTIDINNLGESFFKFRLNGMTVEESLSALRAKESLIEKAPVIGKLGDEAPTSDFISLAEWDAMSDEQQQHLIKTDFPRVDKSQKRWLDS